MVINLYPYGPRSVPLWLYPYGSCTLMTGYHIKPHPGRCWGGGGGGGGGDHCLLFWMR